MCSSTVCVRLPVTSKVLVKFWRSQKLPADLRVCGEVGTPYSHLVQGSTGHSKSMFVPLSQPASLPVLAHQPIAHPFTQLETSELPLISINSGVLPGLLLIASSWFPPFQLWPLQFSRDQGFSALARDIWGQRICCGQYSVHCGMFSSISGFCSLDASYTNPSPPRLVWQPETSRHWQILPGEWNHGGWEPWLLK